MVVAKGAVGPAESMGSTWTTGTAGSPTGSGALGITGITGAANPLLQPGPFSTLAVALNTKFVTNNPPLPNALAVILIDQYGNVLRTIDNGDGTSTLVIHSE